ncbi:hypothetical protein NKDENANG_03930 [Candidatus Entotheonellaceae bacterium PAL068K]
MGGNNDVVQLEQPVIRWGRLLHENVQAGSGDLPPGEGLVEGLFFDHSDAAGFDENSPVLHGDKLARALHDAGGVFERHMQRHHIGGPQQLGIQDEVHTQGVFLVFGQPHDVGVLHVHVEGQSPACDFFAYGAQPDDTQGFTGRLVGTGAVEIADTPFAAYDIVRVPGEFFVDRQDEHQRVFGHRYRVRPAVIGDWYAGLPGGFDVYAVVAGANQLHQSEVRGGTVKRLIERIAGEAQVVLRVLHGGQEVRGVLIDDMHLIVFRQHAQRNIHERGGKGWRKDDFGCHDRLLMLAWMNPAISLRQLSTTYSYVPVSLVPHSLF